MLRRASPRCKDTATLLPLSHFIHLRRILRQAAKTKPPSCGDDPIFFLRSPHFISFLILFVLFLHFQGFRGINAHVKLNSLRANMSSFMCSTDDRFALQQHTAAVTCAALASSVLCCVCFMRRDAQLLLFDECFVCEAMVSHAPCPPTPSACMQPAFTIDAFKSHCQIITAFHDEEQT